MSYVQKAQRWISFSVGRVFASTFMMQMNPKEAKQKAALSLPCFGRDDTMLSLNSSWLSCPQNNQFLNATRQQGNSSVASAASYFDLFIILKRDK